MKGYQATAGEHIATNCGGAFIPEESAPKRNPFKTALEMELRKKGFQLPSRF